MKAEVSFNREVRPSYFKMGLRSPDLRIGFEPGQFFMVRIGPGIDPLLRRPFSIHWMEEGYLEILYRIVGKGTKMLASHKIGQEVDILGPLGKGFLIPFDLASALLVAGGMGVAPLRALAGRLYSFFQGFGTQAHRADLEAKVVAIIGGKRSGDILCAEELQDLGAEVFITTEDGSLGRKGLATDHLGELLLKSRSCDRPPSVLYACGPRPMLARVAQVAAFARIPCQVSLEEYMACGIGACMGCAVESKTLASPYQMVCRDGPVFDAEAIQW